MVPGKANNRQAVCSHNLSHCCSAFGSGLSQFTQAVISAETDDRLELIRDGMRFCWGGGLTLLCSTHLDNRYAGSEYVSQAVGWIKTDAGKICRSKAEPRRQLCPDTAWIGTGQQLLSAKLKSEAFPSVIIYDGRWITQGG